jgi:hypothetical protein
MCAFYITGRKVASLIDYAYLDKQKNICSVAVLLGDTTVACAGDDFLIRIYVIATGKRRLIFDIGK